MTYCSRAVLTWYGYPCIQSPAACEVYFDKTTLIFTILHNSLTLCVLPGWWTQGREDHSWNKHVPYALWKKCFSSPLLTYHLGTIRGLSLVSQTLWESKPPPLRMGGRHIHPAVETHVGTGNGLEPTKEERCTVCAIAGMAKNNRGSSKSIPSRYMSGLK